MELHLGGLGKAVCNGLYHEDEEAPEGGEIENQIEVTDVGTDDGVKLIDVGRTGHREQHMAHDISPKFDELGSLSGGEGRKRSFILHLS